MARRRGSSEVSVNVPKEVAEKYAKVFKENDLVERADDINQALKGYNASEVDVIVSGLDAKVLEALVAVTGERRSVTNILKAMIRVLSDSNAKITNLRALPDALAKYLSKDKIDGWLYRNKEGEERYAFLVDEIRYYEAERESPAHVIVYLKANRASMKSDRHGSDKKEVHTASFQFGSDDIVGKNAADLILESGYLKETAELKAEYTEYFRLFREYVCQMYAQFSAHGMAQEEIDSWRAERYTMAADTRVINDEEMANRPITMRSDNEFWRQRIKGLTEDGCFSEIPVHPYLLCFDLQRHGYAWVHVGSLKPYVYDKTVKDKLILPQDHRDLIDILTADLSIFEDDIVKGKSGGTAILCYGKPGLGKTLTAEVYSEIIGKPLYRIDAGQLGTTIADVEKNLETILKRAERWGAILLIDEADVYIRKRADDLNQNAIVAAFLRTLEYFNGLLFMTTNRSEEVDDAIISRMVAVFKYETPTAEMRPKLWSVLSKQFDCKLAAKIETLSSEFPDASGRDIKQLLRLTKKYCTKKQVPMDVEAFRVCAMFRGLK